MFLDGSQEKGLSSTAIGSAERTSKHHQLEGDGYFTQSVLLKIQEDKTTDCFSLCTALLLQFFFSTLVISMPLFQSLPI